MKIVVDEKNLPLDDLEDLPIASCKNILVDDVIDFVPGRKDYLQYLISRLRYGGKLTVTGTDLEEVSRAVVLGNLNSQQANDLLMRGRKSVMTLQDMLDYFRNKPVKINMKRTNMFQYCIEVERPKNE